MPDNDLTRDAKRGAFIRGVARGLTGPSLLYSSHEALSQLKPAELVPLPKRKAPPASDWARVGNELREAASKLRQQGG